MGTNKPLLCIPSVFPRTAEFFGAVHGASETPSESTDVLSSATGIKTETHMILAGISVAQECIASQWTVKKWTCPGPALPRAESVALSWGETVPWQSSWFMALFVPPVALFKSMSCSSARRSNQSTAGSAPILTLQSLLLPWVGRTSSREKLTTALRASSQRAILLPHVYFKHWES